jgi:predicted nucleotidyltransferase
MASGKLRAALRALSEGGVKFIVVGGTASVLNGASVNTFDLDIVPARDEENVARLLRVLESMNAIYRIQPERRLRPQLSHLRSSGQQNLTTKWGYLDVLGTIGRGLTYEDLVPHTVEMEIGDEVRVRVLDLATIIAIKEELGSEKDLAMLPLLRRVLEEKQRFSKT